MSPNEPLDQMDSIDSAPRPPRLRRGLLVAGAVVLAMGATALTGAALAGVGGGGTNDDITLAAGSGSAGPTASADARTKRDKAKAKLREWRFAHRGHGPLIGGPFGALHGEFVVPDGSGGYRTVVVQRGTASQVGDDTITVKSEDGFSQAYDVPAAAVVGAQRDGLASIDEGDNVMVTAQKKGDTLTAQMVVDLDSWRGSAPFGFGGPGGPGGMGGRGPGPLEGPGDDSGAGTSETAPPTGT
jgi:hypothetical protein